MASFIEREYSIRLCVLQDNPQKVFSAESWKIVTNRAGERKGPSQERCARRDAWELAKDRMSANSKKEAKDTFYSPAEALVMLEPSSTNPEEREFVIDSGASVHMLSKKGSKLRGTGNSSKIQEPHHGGYGQ